jgi:endo-1,4-beta-xylanase
MEDMSGWRRLRAGLALRRTALLFVVPFVAAVTAVGVASPAQAQNNTLRGAAGNMLVGTAVTPDLLNNSTYANIARTEFSSLTAENHMKMENLQPSQGNFNFGPANQIVQFAQQNNQNVYGHTLVWHSQSPGWVQGLSGSAMDQAMRNHIDTVMNQWGSTVGQWDVVNEVIDDNAQLRNSFWLQGLGQGYIADAFRYAQQANPGPTRCMNDYSIDGINAKSNAYYNLVQDLLSQGVPINCMAFQAHLIVGQVPGNMQQNLQRFANLGLEIWITEVDIRMNMPASQQNLQQQASDYAEVYGICQAVSACRGVTTWGIHDAQSWVPSTFPGEGAALMWDDNFNPKPAYNAVLQQLARTLYLDGAYGPWDDLAPLIGPAAQHMATEIRRLA